jgi:hypothetical protein
MYEVCTQCKRPFDINDDLVIYNENAYHEFCEKLAIAEVNLVVAEKARKAILVEQNPWLWDFMKAFSYTKAGQNRS